MFLISVNDGTIIAKATAVSTTEDGMVRNDDINVVYGFPVVVSEVADEEIPQDLSAYNYMYTEDDGIIANPNYVEPQPTEDERLAVALAKIADLEEAVCELSEMLETVME